MNLDCCILTNNNKNLLETIRKKGRLSLAVEVLIERKLRSAVVVDPSEIPSNVATVESRVAYTFNHRPAGTRILARDADRYPPGYSLPVTSLRGLALLGLAEGQSLEFATLQGNYDLVRLVGVWYQPELACSALHEQGVR